eukprot:XP_015143106.1 uncharacterized protein LOC423301 isoform X3 [Gallus gallus]
MASAAADKGNDLLFTTSNRLYTAGFSSSINALSLLRSHRLRRSHHPPGAGLRPLSEPPEKLQEERGRAHRRLRSLEANIELIGSWWLRLVTVY